MPKKSLVINRKTEPTILGVSLFLVVVNTASAIECRSASNEDEQQRRTKGQKINAELARSVRSLIDTHEHIPRKRSLYPKSGARPKTPLSVNVTTHTVQRTKLGHQLQLELFADPEANERAVQVKRLDTRTESPENDPTGDSIAAFSDLLRKFTAHYTSSENDVKPQHRQSRCWRIAAAHSRKGRSGGVL